MPYRYSLIVYKERVFGGFLPSLNFIIIFNFTEINFL